MHGLGRSTTPAARVAFVGLVCRDAWIPAIRDARTLRPFALRPFARGRAISNHSIQAACKYGAEEDESRWPRPRFESCPPGGRSAPTPGASTSRTCPTKSSGCCTRPGSTTTGCCASPASSCRPRRCWPSRRASESWTSHRSPGRETASGTVPICRTWSSSRTSSRTARRSAGLEATSPSGTPTCPTTRCRRRPACFTPSRFRARAATPATPTCTGHTKRCPRTRGSASPG